MRIVYAATSYLLGMNEIWSKVALHLPTSNLSILEVESEEEDDEGAISKPEATMDPLATTDPPPTI